MKNTWTAGTEKDSNTLSICRLCFENECLQRCRQFLMLLQAVVSADPFLCRSLLLLGNIWQYWAARSTVIFSSWVLRDDLHRDPSTIFDQTCTNVTIRVIMHGTPGTLQRHVRFCSFLLDIPNLFLPISFLFSTCRGWLALNCTTSGCEGTKKTARETGE